MSEFNELIQSFSMKEKGDFIQFLKKKNKRDDVNNVTLVNYIYDNKRQEEIIKLMYNGKRNAFHALKKRVLHSLLDFIAENNLKNETSDDFQISKKLLSARYLLMNKFYKLGMDVLNSAEQEALEISQHSLLNEIYHSQIEFSFTEYSDDLEVIYNKLKENQSNLIQEEKLNLAYAFLKNQLRNRSEEGFQSLINEAFQKFEIGEVNTFTMKALYNLCQIINTSAIISNDFSSAELYIIDEYERSIFENVVVEKHQYYHLQILFIIAKLLFRKRDFKKAKIYLDKYDEVIGLSKKYHFDVKYQLLKSMNLNFSGDYAQAILILEGELVRKKKWSEELLDVNLNLIVFYFQQGDFIRAKELFVMFYRTEKYYEQKMGVEWSIKKSLIEILLHVELDNIDYVESRINSVKRRYKYQLQTIDNGNPMVFLSFVKVYYEDVIDVTSQEFEDKVEASFKWRKEDEQDLFHMSFYAWLKSKMTNTNLYEVTLGFVGR